MISRQELMEQLNPLLADPYSQSKVYDRILELLSEEYSARLSDGWEDCVSNLVHE